MTAAAVAYEVLAVRYATRDTTRSDCFHRYHSYGEPDGPQRMDYFFWVLRDGRRTVLVDTGFAPAVGVRRGRTCLVPPVEALARLGIVPESVSQVVLTHLHYDHVGNVAAFPHAELVVSRRELDFWTGPFAERAQFAQIVEPAEIDRVAAARREGRVRCLEGDETIGPGIEALVVGGHSPGQLVLVIAGRAGPVVLATDALHFYEELDLDRPFEIVADLEQMYRAFDTLRSLAGRPGAVLVAGHDPLVLERFPVLADGLGARIA